MAALLDAGAVDAPQTVDIVARGEGVFEKAVVGHEQGAGQIGPQRAHGALACGGGGQALGLGDDGLDLVACREAGEQAGQGEAARRGGCRFQDDEALAVRAEM